MRLAVRPAGPSVLVGLMVVLAVLGSGCARDEPKPVPAPEGPTASPPAAAEPAPSAERSWAHPEIKAEMLADIETVRSPADGGGRAWIDGHEAPGARPEVTASTRSRFPILYEAGPLGVAEGGMIFLQVSPFWGWDTPQIVEEKGPGYTAVQTDAKGITLVPQTLGPQLLGIEIQGRALAPGERVKIDYGSGPSAAKVDRFAESDSKLWIAVDGDGDGVRKLIEHSPGVDVRAARPALLYLSLPGTARPGDTVPLTVAVLDRAGNMGAPFEGEIRLELADGATGLELPASLTFTKEDAGRRTVDVPVEAAGLYRVRAKTDVDDARRSLEAESNPMLADEAQRATLLWGDLQGHTQLSDGSATPAEYFEYGRDAAGLDFLAITDHDHWGLKALDGNPQLWDQTVADVKEFHAPGRFVALLGFEWTNWVEGHRHVVHFGEDLGELRVLSSLAPDLDTPPKLWDALRGKPVLTIAHHSAGGPVPIDWSIPPDPELEPVTEIASVHGSSEAPDSPMPIYNPKPGNYVRDALDLGYRLGFTGGSDGHDGHPGLSQIAGGKSGVAALWSVSEEPRSRGAILDALRTRRSYATNGPRILVQASLEGRPMGSDVPIAEEGATQRLAWNVAGTGPIERIDVIRSGEPRVSIPGEDKRDLSGMADLPSLGDGDYLYLRVVQSDGGAAWTSPFFGVAPSAVEPEGGVSARR